MKYILLMTPPYRPIIMKRLGTGLWLFGAGTHLLQKGTDQECRHAKEASKKETEENIASDAIR